jgi:hypothetical protein
VSDDLDIPAFLRLASKERRAGWEEWDRRNKVSARAVPARALTETERAYRASKVRDRARRREERRRDPARREFFAARAREHAERQAVRRAAEEARGRVE